jgi:hypothetical protein
MQYVRIYYTDMVHYHGMGGNVMAMLLSHYDDVMGGQGGKIGDF